MSTILNHPGFPPVASTSALAPFIGLNKTRIL
uniref:Cytochrome b6/f subunit L n=1 Tax=Selaginella lepidophylla TaxID=59777 RepID=A0A3Q9R499_SELLP|nr:cytochrome b6/f subunit L [Selaginella lepidophylla]AZU95865.1 cytochrome b6/f subunit L [Selaginella lepidophylla]